jgi:hypothetical protein
MLNLTMQTHVKVDSSMIFLEPPHAPFQVLPVTMNMEPWQVKSVVFTSP